MDRSSTKSKVHLATEDSDEAETLAHPKLDTLWFRKLPAKEATRDRTGQSRRIETDANAAPTSAQTNIGSSRLGNLDLNKLVVSSYKLVGFGVLTAILLGLVSYLGINLFYLTSSSWIEPTIVSPTDEHVLQLTAQSAEQSSQRDKLTAERATMAANLEDEKRIFAMDEELRVEFERAISSDLSARRAELAKLRTVARQYVASKRDILRSSRAFSKLTRERNQQLGAAHLVDDDQLIAGHYQRAEMANANLSLVDRAVAIDTQRVELERNTEALAGLSRAKSGGALSYDVLRIKQELNHVLLEEARARDLRDALAQSLVAIDKALTRHSETIATIENSPFLRATKGQVTVAFVPYDNLDRVKPGTPLYGCRAGPLFCSKVGAVQEILNGEVTMKHPLHNTLLRGVMVEMKLLDRKWAEHSVLFLNRSPLLL